MPDNIILTPVSSVKNLGFLFDANLTFNEQISSLTKSCFYHIRDLRRIRNSLDFNTARLIATSLIHSKIDYCNSLYLNLPSSQINRLQLIQNAAARAVSKSHKFHHITPVLKSLHWLKISERIQYKVLSLTYNALQHGQPVYIRNLLSTQTSNQTRSSDVITLFRPRTNSRLKFSNRSFFCAVPLLWNTLPSSLRQYSSIDLSISLSPNLFHSKLKTYLFRKSYPPD